VMLINFGILMFVLARFLYRPIQGLLEQRRQKIIQDLNEARQTKENTERLRREAKIVLEEAHVEAYETVEKARIEAERLREDLLTQARQDADQIRQRAQNEIERSKKIARSELKNEAVNLALLALKKVLGTHMTEEVNDFLIRNVLDEIKQIEVK